ncbi:MAG: sigma-E processing peptidase SpoIIGA [Roseburia sp.]|nr:sigma-E processing peptidase SpoIIGA [Roseburia sp.]
MKYEFYADVFFLTNFYLDFLAVYGVSEILGKKKRICRYLFGSAISSLLGCVLFLSLNQYDLYLLSIHFIVNPAITVFCFFPANKKSYVHGYLLMYFVLLMLGGSMQWLYGTVTGGRYYELCLLLTGVPVMLFTYIIRRKRENVQIHYEAWVCHKGREVKVCALLDTGNRLVDPYTKEPVHILSESIKERLGIEIPGRLVPFQSLGESGGLIEVFTIEKLRVCHREEDFVVSPAVVAAGEDILFLNKRYQMILHSSMANIK